jgi:outer membrane protein OmpA-like peptidoglycan-associated protein
MPRSPLVLFLLAALRAGAAAPLPEDVPLPAGFSVDARQSTSVFFGHEDFKCPAPDDKSWLQGSVSGPVWRLAVSTADKPPLKEDVVCTKFRDALQPAGWVSVSRPPLCFLKRVKEGAESWMQVERDSSSTRIRVALAGGAARAVTLPTPGEHPEEWKSGESPEYLVPFPGGKLTKGEVSLNGAFEITQPGNPERTWAGHPVLNLNYESPADLSPFEFSNVYLGALEKAGWKILQQTASPHSFGDMTFLAHYAVRGRDIWLQGHMASGYVALAVADTGLAAQPRTLKAALDKDGHVALYGIYFDVDKATLKPESEATLLQVLELLKGEPKLNLRIEGHTDNTGARPHNQALSESRAQSVKTWLVAHGVAAARLAPVGFADTKPVGDNGTPEGRSRNRRVELARP